MGIEMKMTQEEKELLLKDLCARLAFGRVKCQVKVESFNEEMGEHIELLDDEITFIEPGIYNAYLYEEGTDVDISEVKPYLRPIHKLTKEELEELEFLTDSDYVDYCNEHHIDYRNLIPKGLALEATKDMYKTE